jgi:carbonic anhydrase
VEQLVTGIHRYRPSDFRSSHRLFEPHDSIQGKGTLLIACSELEANPFRLIATNLTDVCVLQQLGNIVVRREGASTSGTESIEQALTFHRPLDIVVCGHAPCGILDLLANPGQEKMPSVAG